MKKLLCALFSFLMLFSMGISGFAKEDSIMVDDSYEIVISNGSLREAANKFAEYIKNICGKELAVKEASSGKPAIFIAVDSGKVKSGYTVTVSGDDIYITGSNLGRTVRGMYEFLEKFGGVRAYTSELTYTQNYISVPADTNYSYEPFFEYAETDWLSPRDTEYSLFNGNNGGSYRVIPEAFGGSTDYISGFAHTLTGEFCSKDKYYAEHPEYFSSFHGLIKGKQLCLTNPEVKEIIKNEVLALLKEKHNPDAELQIISLTQADNIFYCTCPECKKVDRKYGSHAGSMIEAVNYVARAVREAGYGNVAIDTFAYQYTRKAPKNIEIEDNVIVRLCSFEGCFSHTLDDSTCRANKEFMNDLEGWSKVCKRIYVWDYCTNFNHLAGPFPNFEVLGRNMQIFYEHNVKGVYEEGNYTMKSEAEFGELRSYIISRLFVDPYCDVEALIKEFCDEYYGDGGKYVYEYLKLISENAPKRHLCIYQPMNKTLSLSASQVKKCDELWQSAKNASTGEKKENVIHSEYSWRYWKMKNKRAEYSNAFSFIDKKAELLDEIKASGFDRLTESGDNVRDFFVSEFWNLYVSAYSITSVVLNILYAV